LQVNAEQELISIKIVDGSGRLILSKELKRQQGYFTVALPGMSSGLYYVQLQTDAGTEPVKIIIK